MCFIRPLCLDRAAARAVGKESSSSMPDSSKMYGSVEAETEGLLGYQVYDSQPQTPSKRFGAAKVAVAV